MSHDTIAHRIVRPAVRALAGTPVTPDHLTALRFATGLAAAVAFTLGGRGWLDLGAAVFLFSALLDRADGELARQKRQFSQHGHRYDLLADWSAGAMAFITLGVGAHTGPLGMAAPALGLLAAVGASVLFWGINGRALDDLPHYRGSSGRMLADPDDAMFAVPLLLWIGGAEAVLLPAAALAPVLVLWLVFRRRVRARAATRGAASRGRARATADGHISGSGVATPLPALPRSPAGLRRHD